MEPGPASLKQGTSSVPPACCMYVTEQDFHCSRVNTASIYTGLGFVKHYVKMWSVRNDSNLIISSPPEHKKKLFFFPFPNVKVSSLLHRWLSASPASTIRSLELLHGRFFPFFSFSSYVWENMTLPSPQTYSLSRLLSPAHLIIETSSHCSTDWQLLLFIFI